MTPEQFINDLQAEIALVQRVANWLWTPPRLEYNLMVTSTGYGWTYGQGK